MVNVTTTLQRITAEEALNHEWFREVPLPKSKEFMPTFPAHHAQDRYFASHGFCMLKLVFSHVT